MQEKWKVQDGKQRVKHDYFGKTYLCLNVALYESTSKKKIAIYFTPGCLLITLRIQGGMVE